MNNDKEIRVRNKIVRGERVFLPQSRMRNIRWEEAVNRAQNNRDRGTKRYINNLQFVHWDCTCGSIECLANPIASGR
jgi:hypothetical protein